MKLQEALKRDIERIVKEKYQKRMCYEELCNLVLRGLLYKYCYRVDLVLEQGRTIKREIDNQLENIARDYE